MSAALHLLPTELTEWICSDFEKNDLGSARLVCRQLATKLGPLFFRTCNFDTLTTDLSTDSLRQVEAISQHPLARQSVRELCITGPKDTDLGGRWHRSSAGCLKEPFPPAIDRLLRTLCVDSLPQCRSFRILYKGPDTTTHAHGVALTDVLALLLLHVSESGRLISAFTLGSYNKAYFTKAPNRLPESYPEVCFALEPDRMPEHLYRNPRFKEAWGKNLRDLDLNIAYRASSGENALIAELITSARSLETFSLQLSYLHPADELLALLRTFDTTWKPPLRRLNLRYFRTKRLDSNLLFMAHFGASLKSLSFEWLRAPKGSLKNLMFGLQRHFPCLDQVWMRSLVQEPEIPGRYVETNSLMYNGLKCHFKPPVEGVRKLTRAERGDPRNIEGITNA
ncbi:uncharacterized protein K452DRAFT_322869 [Aplosporella prunicola CBS 121167]|uniref:F-box domain-containing protein n=1 Tax=Aplosporella prunicola CBS 121167 TaxID=1176127 RepID=A0A6A6AXR3_9PEZI|nr:uncharacterized protein K452DRAFT_322869 [Aplosporella prunicola CBS 121167]KAF2135744.1 hypothetical protein K452DRAFT_322869 [Aplosporella prunicola CBS 121167]